MFFIKRQQPTNRPRDIAEDLWPEYQQISRLNSFVEAGFPHFNNFPQIITLWWKMWIKLECGMHNLEYGKQNVKQ